jgi:hypothetical protein
MGPVLLQFGHKCTAVGRDMVYEAYWAGLCAPSPKEHGYGKEKAGSQGAILGGVSLFLCMSFDVWLFDFTAHLKNCLYNLSYSCSVPNLIDQWAGLTTGPAQSQTSQFTDQ